MRHIASIIKGDNSLRVMHHDLKPENFPFVDKDKVLMVVETENDVFREILHAELDFSFDQWPVISESAKDSIKKIILRDRRHPWISVDGVAPDKPFGLNSVLCHKQAQENGFEGIRSGIADWRLTLKKACACKESGDISKSSRYGKLQSIKCAIAGKNTMAMNMVSKGVQNVIDCLQTDYPDICRHGHLRSETIMFRFMSEEMEMEMDKKNNSSSRLR
uniref:Calcium-dependent protein kinase 26-like n=1 Tax=Tanacetum cinerariifolium TaxID=118510 RepID=A0A6L2J507_TANCI|nr:calcium-dependent protein kinase 26-like [Tanacetum cinerariifolium]